MKTIIKTFFVLAIFVLAPQKTEAQFFKKLAEHAKDKIKREAERRSERRVDKKIDKEFDGVEDEIDGKNKGKKDKKKKKSNVKITDSTSNTDDSNSNEAQASDKAKKHNLVWSKYDFVPGDTVIFEDGPDADEENGEFPSRWDLKEGSVEIVEFDGEKVIGFLNGASIVPYLKNAKEDYLPDVFTIEFDVWFPKGHTTANRFYVYLKDIKNQRSTSSSLTVMPHSLESGDSEKDYPGTENIGWTVERTGSWKHISIAYTKGKFKAYFNDARLINIPHLGINPTGITIKNSGVQNMLVKNFRIAKGGVKYYDRVLSEGKIIVNGIKFDVNKATLKSESMGPINRIYKLMVKNPDIKFSVEGHTDSDGSDESNLKLSKERAKTVMDKLISMGIDKSRLKYTGFGESKPIDNNSTPEGKANNRRVEFVKF